jgi:hypothetical protein
MFVLTNNVSAATRVIATLVAIAVVLWSIGFYATAKASNVTSFSDVLSDSAPGASANHLITFTVPTAMAIGETFTITFPGTFDMTSIVIGDVDLDTFFLPEALALTAAVGTWGVSGLGTNTLTFETPTNAGTFTIAGTVFTIDIGTAATGGTNQIVNPTSPSLGNESYEIDIAGTMTDSGHTRVVILDTVLVTATVDTIFDFTVYGNGASEAVNGTTTNIVTGSTTIPFGTLSAYAERIGSQDLTVQTNAINGFVVTVQTDGAFESSTGADIDDYEDGTDVTIPETWASPSAGLAIEDENTWGHWGITSEDATTTRSNEFGSDQWAGVSTTAVVIFSHDGPADEVTPHIGSTTVGYKVEISALQEAGDDYSTTLTYIATPTF